MKTGLGAASVGQVLECVNEADREAWQEALGGLFGISKEYDTKPLADMMKRGLPMPGEIAEAIGKLLDPPWKDRGPKLRLDIPKRFDVGRAIRDRAAKYKLGKEMRAEYRKMAEPSKKQIIGRFEKSTGRSEAYLEACWAFDDRAYVVESHRLIHSGLSKSQINSPVCAAPKVAENLEASVWRADSDEIELIESGTDLQPAPAAGLEPVCAVLADQSQDAEAGAEALVGMGPAAQDDLDEDGPTACARS